MNRYVRAEFFQPPSLRPHAACLLAVLILTVLPLAAQRDPVLKQVDLPHRYYYREMYLPQLTTGPSSAAWTSDSRSLVYSMAGTLWRQAVDSGTAEQLTADAGYDYQPDCSPDGRWVAYVSYQHDAMELRVFDLDKRQSHALTSGGSVNIEPRFSPDGKHLAFVSTSYNGRFHIFVGDFNGGELTGVRRLTGENRSSLPRFYYSEFDHEISPTWSPDGADLIFVSNRGHIYGTGGFWRMKAQPGAEPREIHYEETAWKARPDFSPDGKRIVYASYLGGQWHQLWIMPSQDGDPFPLSYGDFDNTNPRWSPDGTRIAFISNRGGNTSLWVQAALGGAQRPVIARERHYLNAMGHLHITILDPSGRPAPARVSVTGEDDKAYAPDDAWMHAEDNFVRSESPFESHYFHSPGDSELTVPRGPIRVEVTRGFEYQLTTETVTCNPGARLVIHLKPLQIPGNAHSRLASADLHVHMNYGGAYRNAPAHLVAQQTAEDLFLVENLVVNKEQRIPDIAYFRTTPDPASTPNHWLLHGQEFHTPFWGHLALLNLTQNFLLPDYSAYGNTAASSLFPSNAAVEDLAHRQQALVGYAHPFDIEINPASDPTLTHGEPLDEALELPVDAALGKVDYVEVLGFSDHRITASVWYRLLNCGFRLPAGAGSDTMANYASLRGPVGLTRVYASIPKDASSPAPLLDAIKRGRTFATNGPLLGFALGSSEVGEELKLPVGENKVEFTAWLRSFVPVDHLEVVCNGDVVRDLKLNRDRISADVKGTISISQTGWCVLRASSDKPEHPVFDDYVYATTSPVYVRVSGSAPAPSDDAAYFIAWIDRLAEAAGANGSWNSTAEKAAVLEMLDQARRVYASLRR
jgi:Tol biopolymer transport system component